MLGLATALVPKATKQRVLDRQNNKCGLCKTTFSEMVPHEMHRLNHVKRDNDEHNLLALCANCHGAHHRYNVPVYPYFDVTTRDDEMDGYAERVWKAEP